MKSAHTRNNILLIILFLHHANYSSSQTQSQQLTHDSLSSSSNSLKTRKFQKSISKFYERRKKTKKGRSNISKRVTNNSNQRRELASNHEYHHVNRNSRQSTENDDNAAYGIESNAFSKRSSNNTGRTPSMSTKSPLRYHEHKMSLSKYKSKGRTNSSKGAKVKESISRQFEQCRLTCDSDVIYEDDLYEGSSDYVVSTGKGSVKSTRNTSKGYNSPPYDSLYEDDMYDNSRDNIASSSKGRIPSTSPSKGSTSSPGSLQHGSKGYRNPSKNIGLPPLGHPPVIVIRNQIFDQREYKKEVLSFHHHRHLINRHVLHQQKVKAEKEYRPNIFHLLKVSSSSYLAMIHVSIHRKT